MTVNVSWTVSVTVSAGNVWVTVSRTVSAGSVVTDVTLWTRDDDGAARQSRCAEDSGGMRWARYVDWSPR